MPSTSTFYAGVLRPPTISVLTDRCAQQCRSAGARPVVIFTGFSICIPAAGSRACSVAPTRIALGIFWDAAFGRDADTAAEVERKACSGARYDLVFTQN